MYLKYTLLNGVSWYKHEKSMFLDFKFNWNFVKIQMFKVLYGYFAYLFSEDIVFFLYVRDLMWKWK